MPVFRDVVLTWRGVDYTVTPTMRLMRLIEEADLSVLDISVRASQGRPPLSHVATLVSYLLKSAGANVSDMDVLHEIMNADTPTIKALTERALAAFLPVEEDGKNHDAQAG